MAERTVRLARPHPAQAQILAEKRRFNVVALGRRAGKSTLAQHLLIGKALERQPTAYIAPVYKLMAEQWRELRGTLEPITRNKSEQDHRLELVTRGTIEFWSADDPNPGRGRKYALVVVDEAAMIRGLLDIWQLALRPTLADLKGDAWFMSTPNGLGDFYHLFQLGQDDLESDWKSWQMPTAVNPYIATEELVAAQQELPERAYAQEFEAQFLQLEGAGVFRGVQAVARLEPQGPLEGHQYVFGIDWGRSNDFTVISVLDASTLEQVALDRFTRVEWEFQAERLHRWADLYHPRGIVAETNAMGNPIVERLQQGYSRMLGDARRALPMIPWLATNASKAAAIQSLSLAIENGDVTLLEDDVQTGELLAYEAERLPSGLLRYGAPVGQHDDTVIALALAWVGASQPAVTTRSSYAFSR
jgi:hypothetical protein